MKSIYSPDYLELISKFPHRGIGTDYERQAASKIHDEYKKWD